MEDDPNGSEDSHYIPSDIEAEEAYIEKVVEPKRLRGPTRMQDVWDMDADDIIIVNLDKKGRPTGQEGSSLTRFIGNSRVDLNQWRKLVHHWFSEEGQKISKINRENRAKFKDVHCMGTKSLPKLIDEKKKNSNGRSPTRKEIYIETRTRKDGSIVNEKARRVIVTDASNAPDQTDSPSPYTDED
ncbi:hypothetical protein P8452_17211 [Trifolium repens]|nr:hypothetical protein P8452_17211 [Trifolium repens]